MQEARSASITASTVRRLEDGLLGKTLDGQDQSHSKLANGGQTGC